MINSLTGIGVLSQTNKKENNIGLIWKLETNSTIPIASRGGICDFKYIGGYYVFTYRNASNNFYYSIDGKSWTMGTYGNGVTMTNTYITYGNGRFYICALSNQIAGYRIFSAPALNSTTWSPTGSTVYDGTRPCVELEYGNGILATTMAYSSRIFYSTDYGNTWLFGAGSGLGGTNYDIVLRFLNGYFLAYPDTTGNMNKLYYTSDFVTWGTTQKPQYDIINFGQITYGNGKYVVGTSFYGMYTSDLNNVNTIYVPDTYRPIDSFTLYGDDKFVSVNYGSLNLYYSYDGITWSTKPIGVNIGQIVKCVYGSHGFIAIGSSTNLTYISSLYADL